MEIAGMPAMLALMVKRMSSPSWCMSASPQANASGLQQAEAVVILGKQTMS